MGYRDISRRWGALILAGLALTLAGLLVGSGPIASDPGGADCKISPDLLDLIHRGPADQIVRVIIRTSGPLSDDTIVLIEGVGGSGANPGDGGGADPGSKPPFPPKPSDDTLVGDVPLGDLPAVADDPEVLYISPDRKVHNSMSIAAPSAGAGSYRTPGTLTGAGVTVAVIDSGITPHEDLPSLIGFVDFLDPNATSSEDGYGHGTHVAGIIGGALRPVPEATDQILGGMAPAAEIISLRVLDSRGEGYVSDVLKAIDWAIVNKDTYGIRVLNVSLGHPVAESSALDPLVAACEQAWEAGLVVVTSAGNLGLSGNGTITSPGNSPRILTVGAFGDAGTEEASDDAISVFSSRGPTLFDLTVKPDLAAPGQGIVSLRARHSTLDNQHPEARVSLGDGPSGTANEPRYFKMSGSSMASALVSGVAALMLEEEPWLTPDMVKARLMGSARRMNAESVFDRGAGAVDAAGAVDHTGFAGAALSPAVYETGGTVHIESLSETWGDPSIWNLETLYGDPAFWDADVIWQVGLLDDPCVTGDGIIWQASSLSGSGTCQPFALDELSCTTGAGIIWQGREDPYTRLDDEGIIWQGLSGRDNDLLSSEGIIWQGRSAS